jgi:hypothetical protein
MVKIRATNELGIPVTTTPLADLGIEDESISLATSVADFADFPHAQRGTYLKPD